MEKLNFIDLFAGAGGLSEGFIQAGFEPVAHVELETSACNTLKTRAAFHYLKSKNKTNVYVDYLKGNISRDDLYEKIPSKIIKSVINLPIGKEHNETIHKIIKSNLKTNKVDLIIGGPPCQAYSLVGRARSRNGMKKDPRNYLFVQYAEYLEKYQPKMFVFENVIGLKSASNGLYLENMKNLFDKKGYNLKLFTLEASDFGVLQKRRRIIIIGWRKDVKINIPDLESIKIQNNYKVSDLLIDLPEIQSGGGKDKNYKYKTETTDYLKKFAIRNGIDVLTQHIARPQSEQDKNIYRIVVNKWEKEKERLNYNDLPESLKTHRNRSSFFDRFKVVAADLPYSQTIVAHISKDGHYYIHPDVKQNRSLSVREAARLQSFPDNYYFEGVKESSNRTAAYKQIGNAVPPLMAYKIAQIIKAALIDEES